MLASFLRNSCILPGVFTAQPISKVNSWPPMRIWSPWASVALPRMRRPANMDPVGRTQIADDETASGVDDHRVVPADVVVVENDVVVGAGGRSGSTTPAGNAWPSSPRSSAVADGPARVPVCSAGIVERWCAAVVCAACDGVQRLLAQDLLVQAPDGGAGVDAEIFGQVGFQPAIGVEGIGLTLGDVVGGDQLGPKPFTEGCSRAEQLQARNDRASARPQAISASAWAVCTATLTSASAVAKVSTKANSRRSSRNGPRHSASAAAR